MTEETSADNIGKIWVTDTTEREDGGADMEFEMDEEVAVKMANLGLELTLYCAAYKVDIQDVLDWISSHKLGGDDASADV